MTDPSVQSLKASILWFQPCELLAGGARDVPMRELVDEVEYAPVFAAAQRGERPNGLEPPWPLPSRQLFWKHYLEVADIAKVTGHQAWRRIVPFRVKAPLAIALAEPDIRLVAEGFLYRHGVGFVVTLHFETADAPIADIIDRLVALRRAPRFELDGQERRIDDVAAAALDALCQRVTGMPLANGAPAPVMRSIVTPVRMIAVPEVDVVDQDASHRVLVALAHLEDVWRKAVLDKLDERSRLAISRRKNVPGRVLFATDAARVVWFPDLMSPSVDLDPKRKHRLACYHRNLAMATLQTDALMSLAEQAQLLDRAGRSRVAIRDARRHAVSHLGRLYAGRKTYETWSVRAQIDGDPRGPIVAEARAAALHT